MYVHATAISGKRTHEFEEELGWVYGRVPREAREEGCVVIIL